MSSFSFYDALSAIDCKTLHGAESQYLLLFQFFLYDTDFAMQRAESIDLLLVFFSDLDFFALLLLRKLPTR